LRAAALLAGTSEEDDPQARLRLLQAAASVAPLDAEVRAELGRALVGEFERRRAPFERKGNVAALGLALASPGAGIPTVAGPAAAATAVWPLSLEARRAFVRPEEAGLRRELLTPALRDYLQARDACPVLAEAHLGLAAFADELTRAGGQEDYLRRAQVLAPCSAQTWYVSGVQQVVGRQPERAYADWRRSLELADTFLPQILSNSTPFLTPQEMVGKIIPGRPDMLVASASLLYPRPGASEKRAFLEKALACLRAREEPLRPDELRVKAAAHKGLGQTEEALATYRALVKQEPWDGDYRYEMAAYLYEVDRLEECRREALTVLAQEPNHGPARELSATVNYEIMRRRWKR
jgi:tetratricopeptide (TPR) repeat protein